MKKNYINPTVDITRVETISMIAQSLELNTTETLTDDDEELFLSRQDKRKGVWGDEDEFNEE